MPAIPRGTLILLGVLAAAEPAPTAERPNVLLILADDLGYGDLGCYGRTDLHTPHIDRLASQGVRFTSHYANGAECTPTRAALLTGRYPQRVGGLDCAIGTGNVGRYDHAMRLRETNDLGLPTTEQTIVRLIQQAGYSTCISGKWHLGYEPKFAPHLHGFDEAFYCIGGGMDYFHYLDPLAYYNLFEQGRPVRREGYFTDLLTDRAIEFLRRPRDNPFFLYVPFTCPHAPFQGPQDFRPDPLPLDSPLWNQGKAPPNVYIAMIQQMDACVGRLLSELDQLGLAADTVVIFASDNGGTRSARNDPLSGTKGTTYEGGIRVPGIVRWPAEIPAGIESDTPCATFDFTTSIARLAGVQPAKDTAFDGIDIIHCVATRQPVPDRTLYWRKERGTTVWKAARQGSLKLLIKETPERSEEHLFDLATDLAETNDLKHKQPKAFRRMQSLYANWEAEVTRSQRR